MDSVRVPSRPLLSKLITKTLRPVNLFFDWMYHSEYNPFYRSGTLAIGLLFVLLVTGVYLLFFYSVSEPFQSVLGIQSQVWLGKWIRALHRYATDAVLIAVVFHVLQLLSQGKTWGPRTIAWVSGVLLVGAFFVSAWTGYVMVWDQHGQFIALAGLRILNAIPVLGEQVSLAFSGSNDLTASFFFMNLFLHVAIPLVMFFGVWIHTVRLARTVWFPIRSVFIVALAGLFILSILWPAVLLEEANLLTLVGRIPTDWWIAFWIPLLEVISPLQLIVIFICLSIISISIPWWWRPQKRDQPKISEVDQEGCTGCTQCALDCPYDAISMVPHPNGKHLLAEISALHCVSCGICAASCGDLAVGPPGRDANDQINSIENFCSSLPDNASENSIVIVSCRHNESMPDYMKSIAKKESGLFYFDLNCCGTLHSKGLEILLNNVGGIFLSGCAARNCMNRDGLDLLKGRIYEKRVPFISRDVDKKRIKIAPHSEKEKSEILDQVSELRSVLEGNSVKAKSLLALSNLYWYFKRTIATCIILFAVALLSQYPQGTDVETAKLRIVGRLPAYIDYNCRELSDKERRKTLTHMQFPKTCEHLLVDYLLKVSIDDKISLSKTLSSQMKRDDLPIIVNQELDLEPGERKIKVELNAQGEAKRQIENFEYSQFVTTKSRQIHLVNVGS